MPRAHTLRGIIFVLISGISWGLSGTCVQYLSANQGVTVEWVSCLRMSISAVILMFACLLTRRAQLKDVLTTPAGLRGVIVYGIFGCLACQYTYQKCISYTNAGTGTMLEQLGLVLVVAYTCIHKRRKPTVREVAGLILALAGVFFLCTQGNPTVLSLSTQGLAWGLCSSVTLALYVLTPVRLLKRWGGLEVTAPAMAVAGAVAFLVFRPWTSPLPLNPMIVLALAGTIVFGTVLPYLLFLQGVKDIGPVLSGLLNCIEPVSALVFSAVLLGTAVTGFDALGCVLIVSMMILVTLPEKPAAPKR